MKKGGTAIRDVQQKKIFLQYVSNPRLSNKEIEDAFLNPEKNTFLNPLKLRKVNFDNIYNNFERVLIDLSPDIVDTTSHSGLLNFQEQLRKIVLLGSSENPNDRSDVYFRAKLKDPPFSVNFNIWLLRSSETLKNLKKQPTIQSLPSTSQELTQGEKAKLKYVAYLNKISAPNATRDDFYLDSYIEPRIPTFTFLINPYRIIDNISRILQLRAGSEIYPSDNINKVRSLASKLVRLNNNITTLSQLDSLSPSFLQICIDLNNNINTLFSNYSDASANVREASPEIQPVIRPLPPPRRSRFTVSRASTPDAVPDHEETYQKIKNIFTRIYQTEIDEEVNKDYVYYLDIWNPVETFKAICLLYEDKKRRVGTQNVWSIRAMHLLHHLRICLEVLHLIYFRLDDTRKELTYASILAEKHKPFDEKNPLIIYAGWDVTHIKQKPVESFDDSYQILNLDWSNTGSVPTYKNYYKFIDSVFSEEVMRGNRVDTCLEILCMVFSVNYKKYISTKTLNPADRYNDTKTGNPPESNIERRIPKIFGEKVIYYKRKLRGGTHGKRAAARTERIRDANLRRRLLERQEREKHAVGTTLNELGAKAREIAEGVATRTIDRLSMHPKTDRGTVINKKPQSPPQPRFQPPTPTGVTAKRVDMKSKIGTDIELSAQSVIPCYIEQGDINILRERYELHCILIVATLLHLNVHSIQVPPPPSNTPQQVG